MGSIVNAKCNVIGKYPLPSEWLYREPADLIKADMPLSLLGGNVLFYPACFVDAALVECFIDHVASFIYADLEFGQSLTSIDGILAPPSPFSQFELLAWRHLRREEFLIHGWPVPYEHPHTWGFGSPYHLVESGEWKHAPSFAVWALFSFQSSKSPDSLPARFSIIFIGAEGVLTYRALFVANRIAPRILAIIDPGNGDFLNAGAPLHRAVTSSRASMPKYVVSNIADFEWPEYRLPADKKQPADRYQVSRHAELKVWLKATPLV